MSAQDAVQFAFACLSVGAFITAGVLAIQGWALNRPDNARRYLARQWAWGFAAIGLFTQFASLDHRAWWGWAFTVIFGGWALRRASHWWDQVELARRFEREMARYRGVPS